MCEHPPLPPPTHTSRSHPHTRAHTQQIKNLASEAEAEYEKEKLNERVARLSGGVAVIQVRAAIGASLADWLCV